MKLNPRVAWTVAAAVFIISTSILAIHYARGNLRLTRSGFIPQSGLLAANSFPNGAEIIIDDRLVSATDDTVYLEPGTYQVKIEKPGYWPWQKTLQIEPELVTQTNAQLFPIAPSLNPLSFNGVQQPLPSPDGQKIAFKVATSSGSLQNQTGLYVLELTTNPLGNLRQPRQIAFDSQQAFAFGEAKLIWSPDSNQLMVLTPQKEVLLEVDQRSDVATQPDISFQRRQLLTEWEEEMYLRERQFLARFPDEIIQIATSSARNVYISPDKKRLTYTPTTSLSLPENLVPPVLAKNTQPQTRQLEPDTVYLYDREEDTNYLVGPDTSEVFKQLLADDLYSRRARDPVASPSAFTTLQATDSAELAQNFAQYHSALYSHGWQWFTDSKHLVYLQEGQIWIKGYDNANPINLYAGPFYNDFVFPWPDGSRLIIQTTFNPELPFNLYGLELE